MKDRLGSMASGNARCALALLAFFWVAGEAAARSPKKAESTLPYQAALLMEAATGRVLFEENARERRPPASMTKMMLMLIIAEEVEKRRLSWDDAVTTSRWASKMGGSQVYLREGEVFSLGEMMQAITIHSANDASVAVAEYVAGTDVAFVELMNQRAKQLGLEDTEYHTPHGLPPGGGQNPDLTSAFDLAQVAREVVKHSQLMEWSGTAETSFRNGEFQLVNTNRLVRQTNWVDGLKTGYYSKAGFNVTATGEKDGLRLIAVVMGAAAKKACFDEASKLLSLGFARYKNVFAVRAGDIVGAPVPVQDGEPGSVRIVAGGEYKTVAERSEEPSFSLELSIPQALQAPLPPSAPVGEVVVKNDGREIGRVPALAAQGVERQKSLWERLF